MKGENTMERYFVDLVENNMFHVVRCSDHKIIYIGHLFADCGIFEGDGEYTNKLDAFLESELGIRPEQWEIG